MCGGRLFRQTAMCHQQQQMRVAAKSHSSPCVISCKVGRYITLSFIFSFDRKLKGNFNIKLYIQISHAICVLNCAIVHVRVCLIFGKMLPIPVFFPYF